MLAAVMGRGAWLVGGLLGYALACNVTTGPFSCQEDGDCVLQSVPGICDGDGRCAYPDDECSSGFSYPAATPSVGGDCAPGPGSETAAEMGDDDSTGSPESETTGAVEPGSTGTTAQLDSFGTDEGSDSGSSTGGGVVTTSTSGTGSSSDGAPMCTDQIGSTADEAETVNECYKAAEAGTIVDETDNDWWQLQGENGVCQDGVFEVGLMSGDQLTLCVFGECPFGGGSGQIECMGGDEASVEGMDGCCGDGDVVIDINCGVANAVVPHILVTGASGQCVGYMFASNFGD